MCVVTSFKSAGAFSPLPSLPPDQLPTTFTKTSFVAKPLVRKQLLDAINRLIWKHERSARVFSPERTPEEVAAKRINYAR